MKFCDKCSSYMKKTKKGFLCQKCGNVIRAKAETHSENMKKTRPSNLVYVVDDPVDGYSKVSETCPRCGSKEAFHWLSGIYGEHAGIKRERTIEHFKCTKCSQSWTKAS